MADGDGPARRTDRGHVIDVIRTAARLLDWTALDTDSILGWVGNTRGYRHATSYGAAEPCEDEAVEQLTELPRRAANLARPHGYSSDGENLEDDSFCAEQNARLAKNAGAYYRTMFRGLPSSWNLRVRHMAETLDALVAHLDCRDQPETPTLIAVWAHNSYLGDRRATQTGETGERYLGQHVREQYGPASRLVGLTTCPGGVAAASDWGQPVERKRVRPALSEAFEGLFQELTAVVAPSFLVDLRNGDDAANLLREPRLERALGVDYRPVTERVSHYFEARLADRFDAVFHLDRTRAWVPVERTVGCDTGDALETYPFAK